MPKPKFQDFVDELRRGKVHGVFIDDTGSPGLKVGIGDLHPERKSWVAVLVRSAQAPEVFEQFPRAISGLREATPAAREFHFSDIYIGRGPFESVNWSVRLGVFRFMAWIFEHYRFPVLVQTLDPDNLEHFRARLSLPERLGPLNFSDHEDLALFMLLVRVKMHMQSESFPDGKGRVFVDEGRFKNGGTLVIPSFESVFADGFISFANSQGVLPLQLADFAAFTMNRWQLLRQKDKLSDRDKELLAILTPVAHCFVEGEKIIIENNEYFSNLKQRPH